MVLLSSKDVDVHLRTTIKQSRYSFIEKVGIRIGPHTLEFDSEQFMVDGILHEHSTKFPIHLNAAEEDREQSKLSVTIAKEGKKNYQISWNTGSFLNVKARGIFMSVEVGGGVDLFHSVGMMGRFSSGEMLSRQGNPMDPTDMIAFGMEWQVKENDPFLFSDIRDPQWPGESCRMPEGSSHRNLRSDPELSAAAAQACQGADDYEMCVEDVVLTGEVSLAEIYVGKE